MEYKRLATETSVTQSCPIGCILPCPFNTTPPGFLFCDGSAISREVYSDLFAAIGTLWGGGDGSTTFSIPKFHDYVMQGAATAGNTIAEGLPNITGDFNADDLCRGTHYGAGAFYGGGSVSMTSLQDSKGSQTGFAFDASRSNGIYGANSHVQMRAKTVRYIIRYA